MGDVLDRGKCNAAQGAQDRHVLVGQGGLLADAIQQVGDAWLGQAMYLQQALPRHQVPKVRIKEALHQAIDAVQAQAQEGKLGDGLEHHACPAPKNLSGIDVLIFGIFDSLGNP